MSLRRLRLTLAAAILLAACTAPAASPAPSPSTSGPAPIDRIPVSNSISQDGLTITLQIDAGQVAAGDAVRLIATVTNTAAGIVMWQGGGCDLLGNVSLTAPPAPVIPIGEVPQGNQPAAITGLIRWAALASSGTGHTMFVPPNMPPGAAFGCPADLRVNQLLPGATERIDALWSGRMGDGLAAPAGAYRVRVAFPFLARQAAGPFEGDPSAAAKPITVEVPFEVVGAPWQGLSTADALEAALADPRVQAWVAAGLERTAVGGARITFEDGIWRLEVDVMSPAGDTAGITVVEVDPRSGAVLRVVVPST